MRKYRRAGVLVAAAAAVLAFAAGTAGAEVSVNVNIGPPAVIVHEPPEMVAVPGSMVYFAPGVSVALLFHGGYWWTESDGRWYRSAKYNGPWVHYRSVPPAIVHLPPNYRTVYVKEKHVPYGHLKKHYRAREVDYRAGRGEFRGRGPGGHGEGHYKEGKHRKDKHDRGKSHGKGRGHDRD